MTNPKRESRRLVILAALIGALAATAIGQVTTATIYGRVQDSTGAVIPGAEAIATNNLTGIAKSATSDARGEFTIPFLTVGGYTVRVMSEGFKAFEQTGLDLASGQKADLTFVLEIGVTTETINVTAEAPLLNTASAEQDVNLNEAQVHELPLRRRDITSILQNGTGLSAGDGTTVSINGLAPRSFSFSVDGVDAAPDSEFPSISLYQNFNFIKGVSVEAVREVEISKNIFSAEIAQTTSGNFNIITKGGTNQVHGSLFEQYQAGGLNANNHILARKTSRVYHQYGGSLGGPIVRNKVFAFGAFEGYRLNELRPLTGFVPSMKFREEISRAIPESSSYWDAWHLPTEAPANPDDARAFASVAGALQNEDNHASIRTDYQMDSNSLLTVRYTRGRPLQLTPRLARGNPRVHDGLNENVASTFNRVINPTMTAETRFGYNRSDMHRVDQLLTLNVAKVLGAGLPDAGQARQFSKTGSTTTFEQNFAKTSGRHSMKFGGLFRVHFARRILADTPRFSYNNLDDILANNPESAFFNFGLDEFEIRRNFLGFFLQDDIRVSPDLTLNMGVRWDYGTVPVERDGRFFNRDGPFGPFLPPEDVWKEHYNMWSPRVGFAWSLDDKTVLRGGFGVFYIPFNLFSGPVELVRNGLDVPTQASLDREQLQRFSLSYGATREQALPLVASSDIVTGTAVDPNWENSYSMQWTLGIQRQLTDTVVWEISYVGNRGVKLIYSPGVNRNQRDTGRLEVAGFGRQFRYYQSADNSDYHSLQTSLKKRLSRNLQANFNYTYASNLSYFRGDYTCCGGGEEPQDLFDLASNRAPTPFHIRHRFVADWIYELPLRRSGGTASRLLLGGWQIGGIMTAATGNPLNIRQGASGPGARPDIVASSHAAAIRNGYGTPLDNGRYQYLDPAAFSNVPRNARGNRSIRAGTLARRSIYGPGLWQVDMSLSKNLRMNEEGMRVQLRVDLFNAFNHTNFAGIDTNTRGGGSDSIRGGFGRITSTRPGRETQLSIRFDF
ncbi:MAG: TonB-dependent receptor [Bryobacterales bacterium]|nr:TonB-dependent receptor [Bryobacterales bacterium]MDE0624188.1 TonB-dependent receptor [Bryobacterales bacterium]